MLRLLHHLPGDLTFVFGNQFALSRVPGQKRLPDICKLDLQS